jgi:hypothetical protein
VSDRDEEIARIYSQAGSPEPPAHLDDSILAASRRAAGSRPLSSPARRWGPPVALAATVVLTATVSLMVFEQRGEIETAALKATMEPPAAPVEQPARPQPQPAPPSAPPAKLTAPESRRDEPAKADASRDRAETTAGSRAAEQAPAASILQEAPRELRREAPAPPASPQLGALRSQARAALADRAASNFAEEIQQSPEKWVEAIRKLRLEGRLADADREERELRRRYPDYRLPDDFTRP